MKNRRFNQLIATLGGYFWLPCPLCGQMFGGHEWSDIDGKPSSITVSVEGDCARGVGICPDCTAAGKGIRIWPSDLIA